MQLSVSRLKCRLRCPREDQYANAMRRRPTEKSKPLVIGTAFHAGLEAWWTTRGAWDATVEAIPAGLDRFDHALVSVMLAGYHVAWKSQLDRYDVIGVEMRFHTAHTRGILDVLLRERSTGEPWIMEHKSASRADERYYQALMFEQQITMYHDAAEALGHRAAGCIYDVAVKPDTRGPLRATPEESRKYTKKGELYKSQRETDETPEEYRARLLKVIQPAHYQRREIYRDEAELERLRWEVARIKDDIERVDAGGTILEPRNPQACFRGPYVCDYFDVCAGSRPIEDFPVEESSWKA